MIAKATLDGKEVKVNIDDEEITEKANFSDIARDVKAMGFIVYDLIEEFFTFDSDKNQFEILWEYNRARARAEALNALISDAKKELDRLKIGGYDWKKWKDLNLCISNWGILWHCGTVAMCGTTSANKKT